MAVSLNWHRIGSSGPGLVQLARDWSISTPLANWQSIGWIGSSQGWLLGRFPLIKGNDRGADLEMKLYYRDRVPLDGYLIELAQDWFKWHRIGSIGTGLVNQHSIGKLAVHWMDWFISGLAPRAFPFNKGKRPRSRP